MSNWGVWGPFMGIFLLWTVGNIGLAIYKLVKFIQAQGIRPVLSQITLSLEILANFRTDPDLLR